MGESFGYAGVDSLDMSRPLPKKANKKNLCPAQKGFLFAFLGRGRDVVVATAEV
jgi:hypothetical protein